MGSNNPVPSSVDRLRNLVCFEKSVSANTILDRVILIQQGTNPQNAQVLGRVFNATVVKSSQQGEGNAHCSIRRYTKGVLFVCFGNLT